jgi:hypothetical protein
VPLSAHGASISANPADPEPGALLGTDMRGSMLPAWMIATPSRPLGAPAGPRVRAAAGVWMSVREPAATTPTARSRSMYHAKQGPAGAAEPRA